MNRRGKLLALSTLTVGLVVLVAAGVAAKDWIREEWWIHKLQEGEVNEQTRAAERLGELRSVRAVAFLLALFGESWPRNQFLNRIVESDNGGAMLLVIEESKRSPLPLNVSIATSKLMERAADETALAFACIDSVVKIARYAPRGVESALIQALGNDSPAVRACCCNLLGLSQATSEKTGLALRKSLQDNNSMVSGAAAEALERIQRKQDEPQR